MIVEGADTYDMLSGTSPPASFFRLADALNRVEATEGGPILLRDAFRKAVLRLKLVRGNEGRVFFVGNGASASIASHFAADFLKNGRMAAMCFSDPALLTCLANDLGYEHVYDLPIERHGRGADLLVAISSSGRSPNILNAIEAANRRFMMTITLSGFAPDNPLRKAGHLNFWVPSDRYGCVETAHTAILHAILDEVAEAGHDQGRTY